MVYGRVIVRDLREDSGTAQELSIKMFLVVFSLCFADQTVVSRHARFARLRQRVVARKRPQTDSKPRW